jgi:hypothetical protein
VTSIGWASLEVIPSFDGFSRRLNGGISSPMAAAGAAGGARFGDAAGKSAGSRFGSVFKTAAKASLIGLAGAGALAFKVGADAIGSASELNESLNAVTVTYGKQSKAVKRLGRESAQALGLSNSEFNSLAVRFSAFTKTIAGGDGKKVVSTLEDLTTRASDFASVMNLEAGEAAALFQSGLAGESEPLRKFGIDLSAASVEAFAYANGIAEAGAKLTEAEKVQARYGSIMAQTAKTQGDFAKTSDQQANSQRILNARWEDAKAKLGQGLLPIVADFTNFLIDEGVPALEDFSDWFNKEGIPAMKKLGEKYGPLVADAFKGIKDFAKDAAPFAAGIVGAFDNMPSWAKKVLTAGVVGGTLAVKFNAGSLFKGLTGGIFTRGATPVNPLYVIDVAGGKGPGSKLPKALPLLGTGITAAGMAAIAAGVTVGVGKVLKQSGDESLLSAGSGGTGSGASTSFFDLDGTPGLDAADSKVKEFNQKLKVTQALFYTNKEAVDEFGGAIERIPRTIKTTVTGWDVAQQDVRDYLALLLQVRDAHQQNRLDFGPSGQPPAGDPTPPSDDGKGGDKPSGRGVTINIGEMKPHDYKEFTREVQRRSVAGAGNGWG